MSQCSSVVPGLSKTIVMLFEILAKTSNELELVLKLTFCSQVSTKIAALCLFNKDCVV